MFAFCTTLYNFCISSFSLDVLDLIDRMLVYDHALLSGVVIFKVRERGSETEKNTTPRQREAQRILPKEAMQHPYFAQIRVRHCVGVWRLCFLAFESSHRSLACVESWLPKESSPKATAADMSKA